MHRIIFHVPMKLDRERASASQIRPLKILNAFKELGYEVDIIEGYGAERKERIADIKAKILRGTKYDFVYSESSTMPTLLTEKNHFPRYPFLDFSFFSFCKKHGIKIGLFYRDIYWCFPELSYGYKQQLAKIFYYYDLYRYKRLLDVLFIPALEMMNYIPCSFNQKIVPLPSGTELVVNPKVERHKNIHILYVGGIGGDYDLMLFVKVVSSLPTISLTLCCRYDDWVLVKDDYQSLLADNIQVVHKSGNELLDLYQKADLLTMFFKPSEYCKFSVPYKLFESLGRGCPILATKGTWWANFVDENHVGYTCEYDENKLRTMLSDLDVADIDKLRMQSYKIAERNTWLCRCNTIIESLKAN